MFGPYVHDIDPIIGTFGGVHLWWYGLSYSLGFLNAYFAIRRRSDLGLTQTQVLDLAILLSVGVLVGGRLVMVFHSRAFFADHASLLPAVWLGGMATHGLLLGGFAGVLVFCLVHRQPYRVMFDALAIPTAVILACGRIGNFIDGEIVGFVTTVPWAVQFPNTQGFRHPVVLYDGLKNLLIIPVLLMVRRRGAPAGREAAVFLFLYAFLRIFIDLFREYPQTLIGLPAGQAFNVFFTVIGAALLVRSYLRRREPPVAPGDRPPHADGTRALVWRALVFACIVLFALIIPSDGVRDVPKVYGDRHPGLTYTSIYVPIPRSSSGDGAGFRDRGRSGRGTGRVFELRPVENPPRPRFWRLRPDRGPQGELGAEVAAAGVADERGVDGVAGQGREIGWAEAERLFDGVEGLLYAEGPEHQRIVRRERHEQPLLEELLQRMLRKRDESHPRIRDGATLDAYALRLHDCARLA